MQLSPLVTSAFQLTSSTRAKCAYLILTFNTGVAFQKVCGHAEYAIPIAHSYPL